MFSKFAGSIGSNRTHDLFGLISYLSSLNMPLFSVIYCQLQLVVLSYNGMNTVCEASSSLEPTYARLASQTVQGAPFVFFSRISCKQIQFLVVFGYI